MKEQDLRDKISSVERKEISSTKLIDQCVQIAKDYAEQEAIEFAEWIREETTDNGDGTYYHIDTESDLFATECYQIFKTKENER